MTSSARDIEAARFEALKPILAKAAGSTRAFGLVFMPERFSRPFSSLHNEFFQVLDNDSHQFTDIAAPRGWGKTTMGTITLAARKICFQQVKFVLLVSCTEKVAIGNVRNLARELSGNPYLREVFGDLKGDVWAEGTGNIETTTGIRVLARGAGQQVRGLLEGNRRPDLIIVDDLEDPEPYRLGDPSAYKANIKEWFYADLLNSIDKKRTRVVVVGTVLHADSLLSNLLEDPLWHSVRIELCDDNFRSNFPDYMSDQEVMALYEAFARRGMADVFFREYRNLPMSTKDAIFTQGLFKTWTPDMVEGKLLDKVVLVDPAKTVKIHSDPTAIECWGFDMAKNRIVLLDLVNARLYPEQIYQEAHAMAVRNRTTTIASEITALHEFMSNPFNQFLRTKSFPPLIELKAKGKKNDRIAQLAPFYRMGVMYHHPDRRISGPLESQLLAFPSGRNDDCPDCAAYLPEVFHLESKFFALEEMDDEKAMADELALLRAMDEEYEPLKDSWRVAP